MKAIGAGTALGLVGAVSAQEEEDEENGLDEDDDLPEEMGDGAVHDVSTLITQSTDPNRPADFYYEPTGLHIEEGDVVRFTLESPDHTITSYHPAFGMQRRMPAGTMPFSSPILGWDPASLPEDIMMPPDEGDVDADFDPQPSTWLYSFDTPGVYDIECAPHESFGMVMRIVVGQETETQFETSDAEALPAPRVGPVGMAREILTDPNLEPENIVEEGRVEWMDLEANMDETDIDEEDEEEDEELEDEEIDDDDEEIEEEEEIEDEEIDDGGVEEEENEETEEDEEDDNGLFD